MSLNVPVLRLMVTMIDEVLADTWRPADPDVAHVQLRMGDWCAPVDHYNPDAPNECGYAACIIGHAMLDHRLGPLFKDPKDHDGIGDYLCPVDNYERDVLGFESDETEYILFMPVSYYTLQGREIWVEARERLQFLIDHGEEYFLAEYGDT